MSVRLEEVGARPELRRGVRGEEDLQRQRAARRLIGDLRENPYLVNAHSIEVTLKSHTKLLET